MKFTPIIGVEVHIELKTNSKMFCGCPAAHFGKPPNTQTCPVCLGLPGALPVPNKKAVEWTIMMGLALNCQIAKLSKFDRKNYFYPDLPKGYQISQYDMPLCTEGILEFRISREAGSRSARQNAELRKVRIRRVHLEEDTGKLIHATIEGEKCTLIDFNRSGVPLMEIVSEPDIESSEEVKIFLQKLQRIVRYLGISDADMEKGQMRCEPTVNLRVGESAKFSYTPLVEIKNINSFRFVKRAVDYEIDRQLKEFEKTGVTKQPGNKMTRGWSEDKQATILQREKEEAADYRYFPEPDIPPMEFSDKEIGRLRDLLPELPDKKIARFMKDYGLSDDKADLLCEAKELAEYYEEVIKELLIANRELLIEKAKLVANLVINKKADWRKTSPGQLAEMVSRKRETETEIEELEKAVKGILAENQKAVDDYKKGKTNALQYLVGQVMSRTKGKADPKKVKELLLEKLKP